MRGNLGCIFGNTDMHHVQTYRHVVGGNQRRNHLIILSLTVKTYLHSFPQQPEVYLVRACVGCPRVQFDVFFSILVPGMSSLLSNIYSTFTFFWWVMGILYIIYYGAIISLLPVE